MMSGEPRARRRPAGDAPEGAWRFALIVLSDNAASGLRPDRCLPAMRRGLPAGSLVVYEKIMPDDAAALDNALRALSDEDGADCVLTSGGTGLGSRDITPQVTAATADYEVPGIAEAMRAAGMLHVRTAMLSRAVAAVRKKTLMINLPGSPGAVAETLDAIATVLPHALGVLRDRIGEHDAKG